MKKLNTSLIHISLISSCFCMSQTVHAWGLDSLQEVTNIATGAATGANTSSQSSQLATEANKVLLYYVSAQEHFNKALGFETDGAIKEKIANCADGKICTESEEIEKIKSQSDKLNQKIQELHTTKTKLDEEAKREFERGLVPLGFGIAQGTKLGFKASEIASQNMTSLASNPLNASAELTKTSLVVNDIVPLAKATADSSTIIYDYASFNGIEKPEETEAE